jgi:hypothetical protein
MTDQAVPLRKLAERVLAKGVLPVELLLEHLVPVARLRDLARRFGLSPKGGFRIEKAPARVLAPLLAELRDPEQLPAPSPAGMPDAAGGDGVPHVADSAALAALRETELQRQRIELERAREAAERARGRAAELERRVERLEAEVVLLRRDSPDADGRAGTRDPDRGRDGERELLRRLRDLESEREGFVATDEALRRQLAATQSKLRVAEQTVQELEAQVPKGRRKKAPPPPPPEERRFRMPRFLPSFYKSIDGKDRRSIERVFHAVHVFCTEGHSYPGLEVKQLGGQDTWSLRASLGLRVYFRPLADGDIELIEVADREDQHTTLRRLKERS